MDQYFHEIDETPLLLADEEKDLARRIDKGDAEARDHLVRANLRLVVCIARAYTGRGVDLNDLIAEGNLGLLRASEDFDPGMNTRFSTYAAYWIRQSMKRAVISTGRMIRVPQYMAQLVSDWKRASARLAQELNRPPEDEEVAAHMMLSPKKLKMIRKAIRTYQTPGKNPEEHTARETERLVDEHDLDPGHSLLQADEIGKVLSMVDKLSEREATVLRMRFGLNEIVPLTLMQIGEHLGLTRERVRQIERDALAGLAEQMNADG
jgi:RNA polymerase primary sigma factor